MGYTYKADVEEQKSKLVQALQETLNTEFPGSSDVAQEESAKPMNVNDPTPKNKSNFYYGNGSQVKSATRQQQMVYGQQQVGQGAASASQLPPSDT